MAAPPWRWRLAGSVMRRLPDWRGRQRLGGLLAGSRSAQGVVPVRFAGPDLTFHADLAVSPHLVFLQYLPPALSSIIDAVVREGDHVIDIGANEGVYTCWLARRVGPSGRVAAYEPVPSTRERLHRNLDLNGFEDRVEVIGSAVGDETGTIEIWVPRDLHVVAGAAPTEGSDPVEVPLERLDDRFAGTAIRLIKIDVEGFEPAVLRGAAGVLGGEAPPIVLVEVIAPQLQRLGFTERDVLGPLESAGYDVYDLGRKGLRPVDGSRDHAPNLIALHPRHHQRELEALRGQRFPRIQVH